jgi:hypothetical protein
MSRRPQKEPQRKTTGVGLEPRDLPWLRRLLTRAADAGDWRAVERLWAVGWALDVERGAVAASKVAMRAVRGMPSATLETVDRDGRKRRVAIAVQRTTLTPKKQQVAMLSRYWTARYEGKDVMHFPHPFDLLSLVRAGFEARQEARKHAEVSAWRRWTFRWHRTPLGVEGGLPEWMQPRQRGGSSMKPKRVGKTERVAEDGGHEIGKRQDMLALFDSLERREQASVIELTRLASGTVPAWMTVQPGRKRGRKKRSRA